MRRRSLEEILLTMLVSYKTYCKYIEHLSRRETIEETINRNMQMQLEKFPSLSRDIIKAYKQIHDFKAVPSMRSFQFAGEPISRENVRNFNCSYLHIKYARAFAEAFYVQLCGTGVGYSIQKHHINQLPGIKLPKEDVRHIVHDSIAGWADALDALMRAYFYGSIRPLFDFGNIRDKATPLSHGSGKAPGPEPLKAMLNNVENVLKKAIGRKLNSLEVHDIMCFTAESVLSGGIRRSSLIAFFDKDDTTMAECKHGEWWVRNPQRRMANNSVVLDRATTTRQEFDNIFDACIKSNAGEPGFFFTNDIEVGSNPCCEIALNHQQMCNLSSVNLTGITSDKDFHNRVYAASLLGTLQASHTNFNYLSPGWKEITEKEALLGVSNTGIADSPKLSSTQLKVAAQLVVDVNQKYAKKIGINPAARNTCVKPEGNTSAFLGSSSGIHGRYDDYYLRRIRINKEDSLAKYLQNQLPDLIEQDIFTASDLVLTIPQKSPEGAILRPNEKAVELIDRVVFYHNNWIKPGHISGVNTHNVSCTVEYTKEEIEDLREALWKHRNDYNGISLLPKDTSTYQQAPFEKCTKEMYESLLEKVKEVDLSKVLEFEDKTEMQGSVACAGNACEWSGR